MKSYLCTNVVSKIKIIAMKSKIILTFLSILLIATSCGNKNGNSNNKDNTENDMKTTVENTETADSTVMAVADTLPEDPLFNIYTTEGNMVVELYKETPLHRDNFIKLANAHYYDGVLFHRVIYNFMIQTGDPLTKDPSRESEYGEGGPDYTIPAEILPQFKHKKGALAAARLGDKANPKKESSGSQFYIVHNPEYCTHLDGEYTIFGEVIDGFDVIDRIASIKTNEMDRPLKDVRIISVTPIN